MCNEEFISLHREEDIRPLALRKAPEGVDMLWCLQQIEGWQLARRKLPRWAAVDGLWWPPRLSMEQCSSELTAEYKAEVAERVVADRDMMTDLTGGFGVDFCHLAPLFRRAEYVERQEVLCDVVRHNLPLLGIGNTEVRMTPSGKDCSLIYIDPARRDDAGRKVYAIEDCTPDVAALQDELLQRAPCVMVKLSPMLDITQALRTLHHVSEVHVVSVGGECKELLFVMMRDADAAPVYHCVNLGTSDEPFVCDGTRQPVATAVPREGQYLYEPNASIMKAGVQDMLAACHGLVKLHPKSNLFVADTRLELPARAFVISEVCDFSKQSLKRLRQEHPQANITLRNFPSTVNDLRRRLKIGEGGDTYIFATTLADGSHALLVCRKL